MVEVDISLGNEDGVKAAETIKAKLVEFPLARPLTIVIKAFLKARNLTDVSTGGLGGYALINMVIAHLQEEAKVAASLVLTVQSHYLFVTSCLLSAYNVQAPAALTRLTPLQLQASYVNQHLDLSCF